MSQNVHQPHTAFALRAGVVAPSRSATTTTTIKTKITKG